MYFLEVDKEVVLHWDSDNSPNISDSHAIQAQCSISLSGSSTSSSASGHQNYDRKPNDGHYEYRGECSISVHSSGSSVNISRDFWSN